MKVEQKYTTSTNMEVIPGEEGRDQVVAVASFVSLPPERGLAGEPLLLLFCLSYTHTVTSFISLPHIHPLHEYVLDFVCW
jgi:hypothetical protein